MSPGVAREIPVAFMNMHHALKEWAIVVDALIRGEQIIILRKGGISEGAGGFKVDHPKFLLFPTLFHQQRENVIPSAVARYDEIQPRLQDSAHIKIEAWAEVVEFMLIEDRAKLRKLSGQHIWRDDIIENRFDWGKSKSIYALAVRVHALKQPETILNLAQYGGCKSWVELAEDIDTRDASPVLEDTEFKTKIELFHAARDQGRV